MAGGTWQGQNKIRAGAYINFVAVAKGLMTVGDRGIVALPLPLTWGAEGELIEVLSTDMLTTGARALVGCNAFDSESKLLAGALTYAYKALVYRTTKGGAKAKATVSGLTITAKYNGTFGNKIQLSIEKDKDTGIFTVYTYVKGTVVDTQKVTVIEDLDNNDYVVFSGTGALAETAGTILSGGTDGTETEDFSEFFTLLRMARWQVLAMFSSKESDKSNTVNLIKSMREDEGRYVQAVVCNDATVDYEGIINSVCGAVINGVEFTPNEFVAIVAGMTAGADFNESNTARSISGATKIINELTDAEIKKGLQKGHFIISTSSSGTIKVEQDINSLHTFTIDKGYVFSKNRVIRTLDEIGTTTCTVWEDSYMGKVNNNEDGRTSLKADLTGYAEELVRLNALTDFDATEDLTVERGNDVDTVLVDWAVTPVDSMEKLYMTVSVNG